MTGKGHAVWSVGLDLLDDFSRTHDFTLIREYLRWVNGFERESLLKTIFWKALASADWRLAELLLGEGLELAPDDIGDFGPIHSAISQFGNRADVVSWLIDHGAEVERRGSAEFTPLMMAADRGLLEIADLLIRRGADVNATTVIDNNDTALTIAARRGNEEAVRFLLERGADARHVDRWGQTVAEIAEARGHYDIARLIRRND
jgi:ankyrin repeat protein